MCVVSKRCRGICCLSSCLLWVLQKDKFPCGLWLELYSMRHTGHFNIFETKTKNRTCIHCKHFLLITPSEIFRKAWVILKTWSKESTVRWSRIILLCAHIMMVRVVRVMRVVLSDNQVRVWHKSLELSIWGNHCWYSLQQMWTHLGVQYYAMFYNPCITLQKLLSFYTWTIGYLLSQQKIRMSTAWKCHLTSSE